ncbi:MAG: hypothetical protein JF587_14815 [Catenulisporales bacterium]|nr:hypothetical protein [Catenulisporales bacterium]
MAIHSTARGRAAARQAASDLARALPRVLWSYPRRNPVTFTYLVLVCAGLLVLGRLLPGPTADQIKIAISTNPHNMAHRPLTVLAASPLFAATDSGLLSHVVVIGGGVGICMASLERRIGAVRTIAIFILANTFATAIATAIAAAAIHSGRYPAQWWNGYDYGISYGVLAMAAAVTPMVPRGWRLIWAALVFAYPFVSAQWFGLLPNFATIGHEVAAGFGLAAGYFVVPRGAGRISGS